MEENKPVMPKPKRCWYEGRLKHTQWAPEDMDALQKFVDETTDKVVLVTTDEGYKAGIFVCSIRKMLAEFNATRQNQGRCQEEIQQEARRILSAYSRQDWERFAAVVQALLDEQQTPRFRSW